MEAIKDILDKMGKGPAAAAVKAASRAARIATPTSASYSDNEANYPTTEPEPPRLCTCKGKGWVGYDVPIRHPWFGRPFPCICRIMEAQGRRREWLASTCGLSSTLRGKTLSSFDHQRQPKAFAATAEFASGAASQPWLLLQGGSGLGKTHLAAAAVNALVGQGIQATYAYVPDMLERLRFGYEDGSFRQQWEYLRTVQVLVLDDIMEHQTDWVQEQLTGLLDYRLREAGPTMVSMNLGLAELPMRVRSRLSDVRMCKMVLMEGADYRVQPSAPVAAGAKVAQ